MLTYNSAFTLQTQLQNNNYQFQGRLFFGGWILNKYWGFVTKVPITLDILKTGCHLFKSPLHKHLFNMLWSPPCSKRVQFGSVQRLSRVRLFATPWMHARPPCPSPTPGVHWNSHLSSQWCHPAISSSVVPFSSCLQSLKASGAFAMSQLFAWGGQSIGVSALASVLPMNTQDWSPLKWAGWISLQSKGLSRVFSNTTVQKHQFFGAQLSSHSNSHIHTWPQEKP